MARKPLYQIIFGECFKNMIEQLKNDIIKEDPNFEVSKICGECKKIKLYMKCFSSSGKTIFKDETNRSWNGERCPECQNIYRLKYEASSKKKRTGRFKKLK